MISNNIHTQLQHYYTLLKETTFLIFDTKSKLIKDSIVLEPMPSQKKSMRIILQVKNSDDFLFFLEKIDVFKNCKKKQKFKEDF